MLSSSKLKQRKLPPALVAANVRNAGANVSGPSDDTTVPSSWQTAPVTVTVTGSDDKSTIDHVEWKLVGQVKRGWGGATYDLPADAAKPGMSIAIYCGECGKLSGVAQLEPARPTTAA